ncbi:MAG: hypothetical protein EA397_00680 [Deltaproteobacteria bacterium]|nr:MAG: hypothetical protein EA397_00680 [Deltaproteobacteria bacterium]
MAGEVSFVMSSTAFGPKGVRPRCGRFSPAAARSPSPPCRACAPSSGSSGLAHRPCGSAGPRGRLRGTTRATSRASLP